MVKKVYIGKELKIKLQPIRTKIIYKLMELLKFTNTDILEAYPIEFSIIDDLYNKQWHSAIEVDQILKELMKLIMFTSPTHLYDAGSRGDKPFFDGELKRKGVYKSSFEKFANSVLDKDQSIFDKFAKQQFEKYIQPDLVEKLTPIGINPNAWSVYEKVFPFEALKLADELRKTYMEGQLILNVIGPLKRLKINLEKLEKLNSESLNSNTQQKILQLKNQIALMELPPEILKKIAGLAVSRGKQ